MNYLIIMLEKYLYFKKEKDIWQGYFPQPVEVTKSMYFGNIFGIMYWGKYLIEIGIIQAVSKLRIFINLCISKLRSSLQK